MILTDVETELRRMARALGTTLEGEVCSLAADIVHEHGQWQHERQQGPLRIVQGKLWAKSSATLKSNAITDKP